MPKHTRKVYAYITNGGRLLVFTQPDYPEAGIQVPGGTIEAREDPLDAALREAIEETGLRELSVVRLLGEVERNMADFGRDEIQHRWFYHLHCAGTPPESWRHSEQTPSEGDGPIVFAFSWAPLPAGAPDLIAGQGDMLPTLLEGWSSNA